MQVVIFGKKVKEKDLPFIQTVFDVLHEQNINAFIYTDYLLGMNGKINFHRDVGRFDGYKDFAVKDMDFVITLGGDGTILEATTMIRESGVPILGVNLGRLGFLASIEKNSFESVIVSLKNGRFSLDERTLLKLDCNLPAFGDIPFALNDMTLLKRDTSSMITVKTFINGAFLNTYWADGIIVSTPTGSTGYSLSCGGPILFPDSGNFVITPVAPHNLNVRPVVISDDSIISFEVEGRTDNFLCTLDSRWETITASHQIAVRKADFKINLVSIPEHGFLKTIRGKLSWGEDKRN